METVVSGIRPTGNLHLGNYFGMVKNSVQMQHENRCFFFIADYHSLTTHPNPADLHDKVRQVLAEYLACGIDPEVATLYLQSDVPQVVELYLFLNMNAYLGELERTTSFKEKARKQAENINAGLLTYPVLMAADILIHKASRVPVGKDQVQHMEMTRNFANRFNHLYKTECFPEPQVYVFTKEAIKIPGLDGSGKMGKSEGNGIYLVDTDEQIRKKVMKAVTDSGPTQANAPMPESIQNIFTLMDVVSTPDTSNYFKDKYNDCSIRFGDLKKQLAEDIITSISPVRAKINDIYNDTAYLKKVVDQGKEKAQESANKTINEVREIIGFKPF
jgi:tryptophanyl-tRNA synthetase